MRGLWGEETVSDMAALETLMAAFADNYSKLTVRFFLSGAELLRTQNEVNQVAMEFAADIVRRFVKAGDDTSRAMLAASFELAMPAASAYAHASRALLGGGQDAVTHFVDEVLGNLETVPQAAEESLRHVLRVFGDHFRDAVRDEAQGIANDDDRARAASEQLVVFYVAQHPKVPGALTVGRRDPEIFGCH